MPENPYEPPQEVNEPRELIEVHYGWFVLATLALLAAIRFLAMALDRLT